MRRDGQSKRRREASFHPSVPSFIHPSIWSSICFVMVCLLRWGEERVDYKHDEAGKVKDIVKHHFIPLSRHPSGHQYVYTQSFQFQFRSVFGNG